MDILAGRHAFLITAHTLPEQLALLIELLDHPLHDIVVQLDITGKVDAGQLGTSRARLLVLDPMTIHWGAPSQVEAQLRLLEAALLMGPHVYLHMLTGQDLPLVPVEVIHERLRDRNEQFMELQPQRAQLPRWKIAYYHPFIQMDAYRTSRALKLASHTAVAVQSLLGIDRVRRSGLEPANASPSWVITDDFARWILNNRPIIKRMVRGSISGDEVYIATLLKSTPNGFSISDQYYEGNLFYFPYLPSGRPEPFTMAHLPKLKRLAERRLYARKFDLIAGPEVVNEVVTWVRNGTVA